LKSINRAVGSGGGKQLSDAQIEAIFKAMWPALQKSLSAVRQTSRRLLLGDRKRIFSKKFFLSFVVWQSNSIRRRRRLRLSFRLASKS
jgi:hypothetical protein